MNSSFRIGLGSDTHRLKEGLPLIIGGVEIPHSKGVIAHSDGDVLMHALVDAILGALGERDIGYHFPDNDPKWENAKSSLILKKVVQWLSQMQYKIANIDCTIHAEKPKLSDFIPRIRASIARTLNLSESKINIKCKTGENIGFIGKEEGIHAQAIILIYQ